MGERTNENPEDESVHGSDDHPLNQYRCADCGGEYPRNEVRVWTECAMICVSCDHEANKLPFGASE
jgi:hypothetical protein